MLIKSNSGCPAYRKAGKGPTPIVFVHGACQSSLFWVPTLQALPPEFTGYAVDMPGFGDSNHLPGPYTLPALADTVAAFMDTLDSENTILVGNSMGGVVCQLVAISHKARLAKLVLVATGPYVRDPAALNAVAVMHEEVQWNREQATAYIGHFFKRPPSDVEPYIDAALQARREARAESSRSSAGIDLRPDLAQITAPTLVVQGELDANRTPELGRAMAELIPNAELQVIEGVGHTPMLEDSSAWHYIFHRFLGS